MNTTTIELSGELTMTRLDEFWAQVSSTPIATQSHFTLDCRELKYIDAALLQAIAALRLEAQHRGVTFSVKQVSESILRDAQLLGMAAILQDAPHRLGPLRQ